MNLQTHILEKHLSISLPVCHASLIPSCPSTQCKICLRNRLLSTTSNYMKKNSSKRICNLQRKRHTLQSCLSSQHDKPHEAFVFCLSWSIPANHPKLQNHLDQKHLQLYIFLFPPPRF